jgi:hypothetical protein
MLNNTHHVRNKEMGLLKAPKVFELHKSPVENHDSHWPKQASDLEISLGRKSVQISFLSTL